MNQVSEIDKNVNKIEIKSQKPEMTVIGKVADLTAGHLTDRTDGSTSHDGYKPSTSIR